MNQTLRRGLEAAAGAVGVAAAVVWLSGGCGERIAPGEAEVPGTAVAESEIREVEAVRTPTLEWASGAVASARQTAVSSRVLARIEDVRVRAGSVVEEGDVLLVLDARDLRARVGEAEEALRSTEAALDLARRDHERVQELVRSGVAPTRRLDETTSALRAARAEVAGRREALDVARTAASFAEIRSPVAGRVVDRLAEPGDTAVPGRPLVRIYDPSLLRVEAPVRESLAVRLEVGEALRVDLPAVDRVVEGRIDEIVPFAEPGARTLLVKVRLPASDARLFAGMYARIGVPAGVRERVLVPEAAIERVGQLEYATVVGPDDVAVRRLVTTGERASDGRIEVLSGLRAGERVRVPDATSATERSDATRAAAAAVAAVRERLGAALQDALARGPEAAIDVCREQAPRIARDAAPAGVSVGRTSHRLRNPANAPAPWMEPLLAAYRSGEIPAGSARTVDLGARGTGYVEPITLQPPCATCHGEAVDPELLAHIRERYPEDRATGFRVGELRGLFWAVVEPGHGHAP